MHPLELANLTLLMSQTTGRPSIRIGLIDGPVAIDHPNFDTTNILELGNKYSGRCTLANSVACTHGTFVAGILSGKRDSPAPAICPDCTLIVRPIFAETASLNGEMPSATFGDLADAIIDCVKAGVHVINLSVGLVGPTSTQRQKLQEALEFACQKNVIIVVAAGNQGTLGSTLVTRHPWVIPVVAYDLTGKPTEQSNFGNSIGRRGIGAPGEDITSLATNGVVAKMSGTSIAAPFVTGTIALLLSHFQRVTVAQIRTAVTASTKPRYRTVIPPLLNAADVYLSIQNSQK